MRGRGTSPYAATIVEFGFSEAGVRRSPHPLEFLGAGVPVPIDSHLAMTSSREILATRHGRGPKHSLVAFGYSGWGAGATRWRAGATFSGSRRRRMRTSCSRKLAIGSGRTP
jgi:hypothetical protein